MFHACVQRFDGMDEKIFGRELNRALLLLRRSSRLVLPARPFVQSYTIESIDEQASTDRYAHAWRPSALLYRYGEEVTLECLSPTAKSSLAVAAHAVQGRVAWLLQCVDLPLAGRPFAQ